MDPGSARAALMSSVWMCASSTLSLHACMYVLIVVCSHVSMHKLAPVYTRNYGAPRERKRERERYIYIYYIII